MKDTTQRLVHGPGAAPAVSHRTGAASTPAKPPRRNGLDAERFAVVDDELQRTAAYFERLRDELRYKTEAGDITLLMARTMATAIQTLRFELKRAQGLL